jgi:hypothetical protein
MLGAVNDLMFLKAEAGLWVEKLEAEYLLLEEEGVLLIEEVESEAAMIGSGMVALQLSGKVIRLTRPYQQLFFFCH